MIKSIHDLKKSYLLFLLYPINADVTLQFPRSKGPLSYEHMKWIFNEYKGGTITVVYTENKGIFYYCKNFLKGEWGSGITIGKWFINNSFCYFFKPTTFTYCTILYGIYRVYKIIEIFHKVFADNSSDDQQIANKIHKMLYRKCRKERIKVSSDDLDYEQHQLSRMLRYYRSFSEFLDMLGIRKLFLYNKEYEASLDEIIYYLEQPRRLPNLEKKLY